MDSFQQQTSKWKGAGCKLEEYQAAKIYSNETTVDTDFRWPVCSQGGLGLRAPAVLGNAFQNRTSKNTIILTEKGPTYPYKLHVLTCLILLLLRGNVSILLNNPQGSRWLL